MPNADVTAHCNNCARLFATAHLPWPFFRQREDGYGGMLALRHNDDGANIRTIRSLLDTDDWERRLSALRQSREKLLVTNNLFACLDRLIEESDEQTRRGPSLDQAVPIHAAGCWTTAVLHRAVRFGFYNPLAAG